MRTNNQHNPVLVLVTDRHGDVIYPPPIKMMRDHLGLSHRQMTQQATRSSAARLLRWWKGRACRRLVRCNAQFGLWQERGNP